MQEALGFGLSEIGAVDASVRLGVALACGFLLGLDRETKNRPAGLRTHMLVALASALFAILAFEVFARVEAREETVPADPIRMIEAITSGVAFLAAGSIIMARGRVQGLTTGAGMWLAGAAGASAGIGLHWLALLATVAGWLVLTVLSLVKRLLPEPSDSDGN